jgi:hypothetical protein
MNTQRFDPLVLAILLFATTAVQAGTWTPLANQPTFLNPPSQCALYPNALCAPAGGYSFGGVLNANLLTDGSVLFEAVAIDDNFNIAWLQYKLIPDEFGNYANGTWKQVASLPDAASSANPFGWGPFAFASAVLPDGRVIYEGGEYSGFSGSTLTRPSHRCCRASITCSRILATPRHSRRSSSMPSAMHNPWFCRTVRSCWPAN